MFDLLYFSLYMCYLTLFLFALVLTNVMYALGYVTWPQSKSIISLGARIQSKGKRGSGRRRPELDVGGENRVKYIHKGEVERNQPTTLLEYVINVFPGVKRAQAKQWLSFGALTINDEMSKRYDHKLELGDTVMVRSGHIRQQRVGRNRHGLPSGVRILYEDEDLLALSKPAGMRAVTRKGGNKGNTANRAVSKSLQQHANTYLMKKWERHRKKGSTTDSCASVSLAHDVDEEISGVVLFAKSPIARDYLKSHWDNFGITCICVVEGRLLPPQGLIECNMVGCDGDTMVVCGEADGSITEQALEQMGQKKTKVAKSTYRTLKTQVSASHAAQTSKGESIERIIP